MDSINQNRLNELLRKKWVFSIIGVFVLALLLLVLLLTGKPKSELVTKTFPTIIARPTTSFTAGPNPTTFFSSEQLKAIEQQRTADEAVGNREIEIRTTYPWFIKLPLRGEKYFVYFEPNSKVFTGLLYPEADDNVVRMKADIIKQLKDVYGVPVDNFTFKWTTFE